MPRPQTVDPRRILKCAAELFEKYGFEGVTTLAIARAAGISEGALFHYFRTKDDLFQAALTLRAAASGLVGVIEALVGEHEDEVPPLEEGLDHVSRVALDFFLQAVRPITLLAVRHGAPDGAWTDEPPDPGPTPTSPTTPRLPWHDPVRDRDPRSPSTLLTERGRFGPAHTQKLLAEYLRELERRGDAVPGDAAARAVAFLGGLFAYAFLTEFELDEDGGGSLPERERFRRQYVADFVRALKADRRSRRGEERDVI